MVTHEMEYNKLSADVASHMSLLLRVNIVALISTNNSLLQKRNCSSTFFRKNNKLKSICYVNMMKTPRIYDYRPQTSDKKVVQGVSNHFRNRSLVSPYDC